MMNLNKALIVRELGLQNYTPLWQTMLAFTKEREKDTFDEAWLLEHPPVYTQGYAGKPEHLIHRNAIPVVETDRGGQITYHGPGQWIFYSLVHLPRRAMGVKQYVHLLERTLIDWLASLSIEAHTLPNQPGIYIDHQKLASIGLRVKHGYTYHGIAINVDMDLTPFQAVNPCGYPDLTMTQLADHCTLVDKPSLKNGLIESFCQHLGYNRRFDVAHDLPIHAIQPIRYADHETIQRSTERKTTTRTI